MSDRASSASNSFKLIRFFRIVSVLGGAALFARALLVIVIIGGIVYSLP